MENGVWSPASRSSSSTCSMATIGSPSRDWAMAAGRVTVTTRGAPPAASNCCWCACPSDSSPALRHLVFVHTFPNTQHPQERSAGMSVSAGMMGPAVRQWIKIMTVVRARWHMAAEKHAEKHTSPGSLRDSRSAFTAARCSIADMTVVSDVTGALAAVAAEAGPPSPAAACGNDACCC